MTIKKKHQPFSTKKSSYLFINVMNLKFDFKNKITLNFMSFSPKGSNVCKYAETCGTMARDGKVYFQNDFLINLLH